MRRQPSFLIIDSSYPINTRNEKIIYSLRELFPDCEIEIVTWNRDLREAKPSDTRIHLFTLASAYGKPIKKLRNLSKYYRFIKNVNEQSKPSVLIASHWDMMMMATKIKKKNQVLIYENLDIPKANNTLLLSVLQFMEKQSLRNVDMIIFASRFFEPLYKQVNCKKIIVENKPIDNTPYTPLPRQDNEELTVSYIGSVRYLPIMKNLVDAVKRVGGVRLNVHGEGYQLVDLIQYTGAYNKICFTGRYEYNTIGNLYGGSDVIWGVYPNDDYNVKFAISNKFHESLYYQVPCIYASETKLGEMVEENGIGFTVNPYRVEAIVDLLTKLRDDRMILHDAVRKNKEFLNKEKSWREEIEPVKGFVLEKLDLYSCL